MTSRHHFKTQQEQLVYNNREKMLDAFFQLLREHDPRRTPMTDWGAFSEKVFPSSLLLPENFKLTTIARSQIFLPSCFRPIYNGSQSYLCQFCFETRTLLENSYLKVIQTASRLPPLYSLTTNSNILSGFSLPQSDKLRKLSQRVAPSIGPSQLATFPHLQEFFLKFLLDANHYAFSTQVCQV